MTYKVHIDVSTVYELVSSFMVYATRKWTDNLDIGKQLITRMDACLPQPVRVQMGEARFWPLADYDVLYAIVMLRGEHDEIPDFLHWLETSSSDELHRLLAEHISWLTADETNRIRTSYTPLLKLWHEHYFAEVESDLRPLLQEDAEEKQLLLTKMDPENLIEYASSGVILDHVPQTNVTLFPGTHFRPINTYCFYDNLILLQYPIDIPEEDEDEPPVVLLRMTEALADPERLKLLRYIADEPKAVSEMAVELGQPYETLMHHLMILRAAGLLRSHLKSENNERFSLRPDGASELQMFLENYIRLS
ncbi:MULTISPECIES: ArsR/SmtB family transcription factor [Paenibacillus]|uniref:ArsR family transcriptional regulator n=1 Tax=Paenibacillus campinasensis TaxID=66347 RepID=A0A268F1W6_9BACL|nr:MULTISPECIES: helix-turn-helix domain-containing protein [Paenibacillus]MUG65887.1 ArsR family transcriptional regulator [Paenibacillus campinasensis]PAD79376.1 ArsR family transcriptional regulator [Paenibacillus campinasensis]PAK51681.1 ArsR family transcriptional regulator [Paenibacillus sp. 7541]